MAEASLPSPLSIIGIELLVDVLCFVDGAEPAVVDEDAGRAAVDRALDGLRSLSGPAREDFMRIAATIAERAEADLRTATGTIDIANLEHRVGFLSGILSEMSEGDG